MPSPVSIAGWRPDGARVLIKPLHSVIIWCRVQISGATVVV